MNWASEVTEVDGVALQVRSHGSGRPVIALHGDEVCQKIPPFESLLAQEFRVIVPSFPGVNESELPTWVENVDDLAYLMLDLIEHLALGKVDLLGHGFGGWVAAEMAVRSTTDIRRLVLIDSFGIKTSAPTVRDIQDLYVLPADEVVQLAWHDPSRAGVLAWPGAPGTTREELLALLGNRQSVLGFGWSPFMHNPKLLRRLHRVRIPALVVWGESDRVVLPESGRAFQNAIPRAGFELISEAGHYPHWEQPDALADAVISFLNRSNE